MYTPPQKTNKQTKNKTLHAGALLSYLLERGGGGEWCESPLYFSLQVNIDGIIF